jgi:coproporphyrinogen III oxidase-like Fe-S oxidoreductase
MVMHVQVEEATPFGRWHEQGVLALPSEDVSVQQWVAASSMLCGAGFQHYELSNYAKPGHACKHNMVYWLGCADLLLFNCCLGANWLCIQLSTRAHQKE